MRQFMDFEALCLDFETNPNNETARAFKAGIGAEFEAGGLDPSEALVHIRSVIQYLETELNRGN